MINTHWQTQELAQNELGSIFENGLQEDAVFLLLIVPLFCMSSEAFGCLSLSLVALCSLLQQTTYSALPVL